MFKWSSGNNVFPHMGIYIWILGCANGTKSGGLMQPWRKDVFLYQKAAASGWSTITRKGPYDAQRHTRFAVSLKGKYSKEKGLKLPMTRSSRIAWTVVHPGWYYFSSRTKPYAAKYHHTLNWEPVAQESVLENILNLSSSLVLIA